LTCSDCGQATLSPGVCIDCSNKRFDDYPRLKAIVDRLEDYTCFYCHWDKVEVYHDLKKIIDPEYKPSVPLELDQIKPKVEQQ